MGDLVREYRESEDITDALRKKKIKDAQWKEKLDSRKRDKVEREKEKMSYRDPTENIDAYHKRFRDLQKKVEFGMIETEDLANGDDGIERTELKRRLDSLKEIVDLMQKELTSATMYLPDYDVQSGSTKIAKCTSDIESARLNLAPRKKFAFGAKKKKQSQPVVEEIPVLQPVRAAEKFLEQMTLDGNELVFQEEANKTIVVEDKNKTDQDVRFSKLTNCIVELKHQTGAVRFLGLDNCKLYIGPVAGSCFFENCTNCVFMIASRQIRIHDTTSCDFYLHVLSRPIIEHCSNLKFAPYALSYASLETQLRDAGLEADRAADMWKDVDDFRWLKHQQSPNWSMLPQDQRVAHALIE